MSRKRSRAQSQEGSAGSGSSSTVENPEETHSRVVLANARGKRHHGAVSPLVRILDDALQAGTVVRSESAPPVYTGFAQYASLMKSGCAFLPMNTNRAINDDVVAERVLENEENYGKCGTYLEFGQINLIVIESYPKMEFFIMDGQHRVKTMDVLASKYPERPIFFQFRAKVLSDQQNARFELLHFQKSYPSDPRCFLENISQNRIAAILLARMKEAFPRCVFKPISVNVRYGKRIGDPDRPYLNDSLFFWLLSHSGLMSDAPTELHPVDRIGLIEGLADGIWNRLMEANAALALELPIANHAAAKRKFKITEAMIRKVESWFALGETACYLGFLREGKLEWPQLLPLIANYRRSLNN